MFRGFRDVVLDKDGKNHELDRKKEKDYKRKKRDACCMYTLSSSHANFCLYKFRRITERTRDHLEPRIFLSCSDFFLKEFYKSLQGVN